mmetsp:Transcript_12340/g.31267  ORF Transcript_12340/g.31267 Transcript_12340/m.31267 type:complete len:216 (+) Transcript_12340:153-800(+)
MGASIMARIGIDVTRSDACEQSNRNLELRARDSSVAGELGEWRVHREPLATLDDAAWVGEVLPSACREVNLPLALALDDNRGDDDVVAERELVVDLKGGRVLRIEPPHGPHDGVQPQRRVLGQPQHVSDELLPHRQRLRDHGLRLLADVPRRDRELHGRHERVDLRPAHEEFRVWVPPKVGVASDDVRQRKRVPEEARGEDGGNDGLQAVPHIPG